MQGGRGARAARGAPHLVGTLVSLLGLLLCQVSIQLGLPEASLQAGSNVHRGNHLLLHAGLGSLQLLGQLHHMHNCLLAAQPTLANAPPCILTACSVLLQSHPVLLSLMCQGQRAKNHCQAGLPLLPNTASKHITASQICDLGGIGFKLDIIHCCGSVGVDGGQGDRPHTGSSQVLR